MPAVLRHVLLLLPQMPELLLRERVARFIEADYEGAWGEDSKMVMRINLPEEISVPQVQLWIAALQAAAPKIMIGENAADMVRL